MIQFDKRCTGCGACIQKCPNSCIELKRHDLGFYYPDVDLEKCIRCGLCNQVCPINIPIKQHKNQEAFAVVNCDFDSLKNSASGGAFAAISEWILNKDGVVYGCSYDENLSPKMICIHKKSELWKLQGSKYVQSDTGRTYTMVKDDLTANKYVLYSGTPCQIDGLKSFLGKEHENLLTVDLVCHGVPSAEYFQSYIRYLEKRTKSKIHSFNFRSKGNNGWRLSGTYTGTYTGTGKEYTRKINYFSSYYYSYFLYGEIYRESCYICKYANMHRVGDFTLGDLWGAEGMQLPFKIKNGCSLVIANTDKAKQVLKELNVNITQIDIQKAIKSNKQLSMPTTRPTQRDERAEEYRSKAIDTIGKNFMNTYRKKNLICRISYLIPKSVRNMLLKIRYSR